VSTRSGPRGVALRSQLQSSQSRCQKTRTRSRRETTFGAALLQDSAIHNVGDVVLGEARLVLCVAFPFPPQLDSFYTKDNSC
jgi:hypothetical protein